MTQMTEVRCDEVTQTLGERMRQETAEFLSTHLGSGAGDAVGWPGVSRPSGGSWEWFGGVRRYRRLLGEGVGIGRAEGGGSRILG